MKSWNTRAKPQKSSAQAAGGIIEDPIKSNFKEGLSVVEYFISTHGARKGLADTALKTADAGYLTRRLVDVGQDTTVTTHDCGTLRGVRMQALKDNEDIVESLRDRIVGRVSVHDVRDPQSEEVILKRDDLITEEIAEQIEAALLNSMNHGVYQGFLESVGLDSTSVVGSDEWGAQITTMVTDMEAALKELGFIE